jgi:hypothetical protein
VTCEYDQASCIHFECSSASVDGFTVAYSTVPQSVGKEFTAVDAKQAACGTILVCTNMVQDSARVAMKKRGLEWMMQVIGVSESGAFSTHYRVVCLSKCKSHSCIVFW